MPWTCCSAIENKLKNDYWFCNKLDDSKKWYLPAGKCVDDELYYFGLQCFLDHPSQSLIMDSDETNYRIVNIFTEVEIKEMRGYNEKPLPKMPAETRAFLNSYNRSTASDLRQMLHKQSTYLNYAKDDFDKDWINHTVHSLAREYKSDDGMNKEHKKFWYQSHVGCMIESCLTRSPDVESGIEESISLSSRKRKYQERCIQGVNEMEHTNFGNTLELVFRQVCPSHEVLLEFGGSEAGSLNQGVGRTNAISEAFCKLPKCLKDMLDYLLDRLEHDDRAQKIQTVGLIHSGSSSTLLRVNRPTAYISRVSRSKKMDISSSTVYQVEF